ncbi:hypothetical protein LTS18_000111 [Coniosporium uncinatum]|uniref:Uncharacterized protein n=1 Tax=Coniosporium uncinatum TaxID=93489 RepID=A0ACC3DZQ4_9PEZI|nr:hypothetical protein LTS18_000111 [Coniosporium uncinatum]
MPFSHHSHSGQFCNHAKNTLEEMIKRAISQKMQMFALTEHMPRRTVDFYPEERDLYDEEGLFTLFDSYYTEAMRLKDLYAPQIEILIGFESEWIRPESHNIISDLQNKYPFDLFVGSIHHVKTVPIDFDRQMYEEARERCGGTDERIFEAFFDEQYEMLQALEPPVVGHLDLIRLKSDQPNLSMRTWDGVWKRVLRNLEFIQQYGGLVELNSAALRKGLSEPYPQVDICKVCFLATSWRKYAVTDELVPQTFVQMGGHFTLSDDSHEIAHVGACYQGVLNALETSGINEIRFLTRSGVEGIKGRTVTTSTVAASSLREHDFFKVPT